VENAVKHGVGMKEDGGTVTIATKETDTAFEVIVTDDGVGFDPDAPKPDDGKSHIGMENTKKRLRDMCGAHVEITSAVGEGTTARVILPKEGEGPYPAVITGDQCFPYAYDKEYINAFIDHDIALVLFNRTELVPDVNNYPERLGQLYDAYPEYTFGALGAWAWGYSRCVDALEQIGEGIVDMSCIAFTGHSRGGKTAALAGALDERAVIVNPNATCAGACGCYRLHMKALTEDGKEERSETLEDMNKNFPFWLGEGMKAFDDREEELPFDAHFLKAMVAPRVLFVSEAASDIWSNPVGSWLTSEAAKEVYKLFDKEENLLWYFRSGYHYQNYEDIGQLVNIIRHVKYGEPLNDKFYQLPFEAPEAAEAYDWKGPEK
jgi:hypothetical protein